MPRRAPEVLEQARERKSTGTRRRPAAVEFTRYIDVATDQWIQILSTLEQPALIIDKHGTLLFANAASERAYHWKEADWLGRRTSALLERPSIEEIIQALEGRAEDAQSVDIDAVFRVRGGAGISTRLKVTPLRGHDGTDGHFCVTGEISMASVAPVSEGDGGTGGAGQLATLKTVTHPASALLSSVGRLAAEIAHDINNQLAVVLNYAYILQRSVAANPDAQSYLSELREAAWSASHRAGELLRFGDRSSAATTVTQLREVIEPLLPLLEHTTHGRIRPQLLLDAPHAPVRIRVIDLEQALVRLVLASRFVLAEGETIRIQVADASVDATDAEALRQGVAVGDYVVVRVGDYPAEAGAHGGEVSASARAQAWDEQGPVANALRGGLEKSHGKLVRRQLSQPTGEEAVRFELYFPAQA